MSQVSEKALHAARGMVGALEAYSVSSDPRDRLSMVPIFKHFRAAFLQIDPDLRAEMAGVRRPEPSRSEAPT